MRGDLAGLLISVAPPANSWARTKRALSCLQQHAWYTGTGDHPGFAHLSGPCRTPARAKALLLRVMLAHHYARMRQRQRGEPESVYLSPLDAGARVAALYGVPSALALVTDVYRAYCGHHAGEEQALQVASVEEVLCVALPGGRSLAERLPLVVRDAQGQVWARPSKMVTRLVEGRRAHYAASGQLLSYQRVAAECIPGLAGVQLDLTEISAKPKFASFLFSPSPGFAAALDQTVVDTEVTIARLTAEGRPLGQWPRAMGGAACEQDGACPFLDKCHWGADHVKGGNWTFNA